MTTVKTAALQKRAAELRRKMFASLPVQVRVAYVMRILYASDPILSMLGKSLGAAFILRGVQGLPDVNGKPVVEWATGLLNKGPESWGKADLRKLTDRLPPSYLDHEMMKVRAYTMGKFGAQDAMDTIQSWLGSFIGEGKWTSIQEGVDLKTAIAYCVTGLKNSALNLKKKRHRQDISMDDNGGDEDRRPLEFSDPKSIQDYAGEEMGWREPKIRRLLEQKAHPDAPLFLDLLAEGHTVKEVVAPSDGSAPLLPSLRERPISLQGWMQGTMPKIEKILSRLRMEEAGGRGAIRM